MLSPSSGPYVFRTVQIIAHTAARGGEAELRDAAVRLPGATFDEPVALQPVDEARDVRCVVAEPIGEGPHHRVPVG
jgi:hypothetical protein